VSATPKKVLVVANPYPPMASAGITRVVRFLRHLPEHEIGRASCRERV
jgi:hypothetical protein